MTIVSLAHTFPSHRTVGCTPSQTIHSQDICLTGYEQSLLFIQKTISCFRMFLQRSGHKIPHSSTALYTSPMPTQGFPHTLVNFH